MRKPEIQKWIDGLRSGKYEQARGTIMETDGSMCCLGVLADVNYVLTDKSSKPQVIIEGYNFASDILTQANSTKFQGFNDREKLSFAQIADKAEEIFPNA